MTDAQLGDALPLPVRDEAFLNRLATRRSAPAQTLAAPGPSPDELQTILTVGARTPDHGKLFPWRFVVLGPETKVDLVRRLTNLAAGQPGPDKARKVLEKLSAPPATILVVSASVADAKPEWEQVLSAGAVCMNLVHAANALGYATNWITDWYAYDADALTLFGMKTGERVAGFIHIGTVAEPPLERPRPDMTTKVEFKP